MTKLVRPRLRKLACVVSAFAFLTLAREARADVRCESLFETATAAKAVPVSPVAKLTRAHQEIELEQEAARAREWTPEQLTEIHLKGRLEFETGERAIKYYRGLIVWKLRELSTAIQHITEYETVAHYKSIWPTKVNVLETSISLFVSEPDFLHALSLMKNVMHVEEPSADQTAAMLAMMAHARSIRRNPWIDQVKFGTESMTILRPAFENVSSEQLEAITQNPTPKFREIECCGTGNCAGCTHPNVVFRDLTQWHGPTHVKDAAFSTLPLYQIMDRLRAEFPDEKWGNNFWDARVAFELGREKN